jgi:hypothetical protein
MTPWPRFQKCRVKPRGCFVEGGGVGSEGDQVGDQSFAKRSPNTGSRADTLFMLRSANEKGSSVCWRGASEPMALCKIPSCGIYMLPECQITRVVVGRENIPVQQLIEKGLRDE